MKKHNILNYTVKLVYMLEETNFSLDDMEEWCIFMWEANSFQVIRPSSLSHTTTTRVSISLLLYYKEWNTPPPPHTGSTVTEKLSLEQWLTTRNTAAGMPRHTWVYQGGSRPLDIGWGEAIQLKSFCIALGQIGSCQNSLEISGKCSIWDNLQDTENDEGMFFKAF